MFNWFKNKNKRSSNNLLNSDYRGWDNLVSDSYIELDKQPEVIKAVRVIADTVSNIPIMLLNYSEESGKQRLKNSLSRKIDIEPNENMTRKQFIFKIVEQMLLTGNSIVIPTFYKQKNKNTSDEKTFIKNLDILKNDSFKIENNNLVINNKNIKFNNILNFCLFPNENCYQKGNGYKEKIKEIALSLKTANDTKKSFLQNKYKPSIVISVNGDSEELEDENKRNNILNSYIGNSEAGKPWLIPAGEIDLKTITPLSLNDLAIIDGLKLDITRLASLMGIPKFMLGIGEYNKDEYNNFINTTILNITTIIEQELTKKLLWSSNHYFKFNIKKIMHHSLSDKIVMATELTTAGMLTRNEGRAMFDYSPINSTGMNDIVILENYIPIDKTGKQNKLEKGGEDDGEKNIPNDI